MSIENNAAVMGARQPETLAGQAWGPTIVLDNGRLVQGSVNSYHFRYSCKLPMLVLPASDTNSCSAFQGSRL